jgi:hypothetical protein
MEEYSTEVLNDIVKKIQSFKIFHHIEILQILKKHNVSINENQSGSFINLSEVKKNIIDELKIYVEFAETQEKLLKDYEVKKENIKKTFFDIKT